MGVYLLGQPVIADVSPASGYYSLSVKMFDSPLSGYEVDLYYVDL